MRTPEVRKRHKGFREVAVTAQRLNHLPTVYRPGSRGTVTSQTKPSHGSQSTASRIVETQIQAEISRCESGGGGCGAGIGRGSGAVRGELHYTPNGARAGVVRASAALRRCGDVATYYGARGAQRRDAPAGRLHGGGAGAGGRAALGSASPLPHAAGGAVAGFGEDEQSLRFYARAAGVAGAVAAAFDPF